MFLTIAENTVAKQSDLNATARTNVELSDLPLFAVSNQKTKHSFKLAIKGAMYNKVLGGRQMLFVGSIIRKVR